MSYFNQIIERSEGIQPIDSLQPIGSNFQDLATQEVDNPFDQETIFPISSPPEEISMVNYSRSNEIPSPNSFIEESSPSFDSKEKEEITRKVITNKISKETIITKQQQLEKKSEKKTKPVLQPNKENLEVEAVEKLNKPSIVSKDYILEKLNLKPQREIPPIATTDFKSLKPPKEEKTKKVTVKKKNKTIEGKQVAKPRLLSPELQSMKSKEKTNLIPRKKVNNEQPFNRKLPEKKLSIGKIMVEILPPVTASPTQVRTIYQSSKSPEPNLGSSNLRYNLRFGLGQI